MKLLIVALTLLINLPLGVVNADEEWGFFLMPEADDETVQEASEEVWEEWWEVRETYGEEAEDLTLWEQLASWIMNWDTLIEFAAYSVHFLSQIWLVIWAWMIIYAGYIYAMWVFTWNASQGWEPVKNAIIWVLVIIFSYAIINILTSMFL